MWTVVASYLTKVSVKVVAIALAVLAVVAWLFQTRRDAIKIGEHKVRDAVQKETEEIRETWKKIDDTDPTVSDAIDELRKP